MKENQYNMAEIYGNKNGFVSGIKKKRLRLRIYPDPVLSVVCKPVLIFDKRIHEFVEKMYVFMKKNKGIGLAAPQVGVLNRIIVVNTGETTLCLINPDSIAVSDDYDKKMEGCLSLPDQVYTVKRNFAIEVNGKNEYGKNVRFKAVDLPARVIQHEIDHLDGRLICDIGVLA